MQQDSAKQAFFDHFGTTKVTWVGRWLTRSLCDTAWQLTGLKTGDAVLEIGPGRGDFARLCIGQKLTYHAVEGNHRMARALQQMGAEVRCQRVPPLPSLSRKYNAVVLMNVLEHMNSMEDALLLVSQIRDQLLPGGRVLICCPDYLNWGRDFFHCDFSHNYVVTQRRLQQLLVNAGYGRIKGTYVSGSFRGVGALVFSSLVRVLPFSTAHAWFPSNTLIAKFYKLKLSLLRKVVAVGYADE